MGSDLTVKEIAAIIHSDNKAIGFKEFNVTSDYETLIVKEKNDFDDSIYDKVFNVYEKNIHPHSFEFNYDIYIEKTDEPLTLM